VSLPSTILGRAPSDVLRGFICANTYAAARPSFSAVSAVTGSTFATPRTPSVPNIFFGSVTALIETLKARFVNGKLWHQGTTAAEAANACRPSVRSIPPVCQLLCDSWCDAPHLRKLANVCGGVHQKLLHIASKCGQVAVFKIGERLEHDRRVKLRLIKRGGAG